MGAHSLVYFHPPKSSNSRQVTYNLKVGISLVPRVHISLHGSLGCWTVSVEGLGSILTSRHAWAGLSCRTGLPRLPQRWVHWPPEWPGPCPRPAHSAAIPFPSHLAVNRKTGAQWSKLHMVKMSASQWAEAVTVQLCTGPYMGPRNELLGLLPPYSISLRDVTPGFFISKNFLTSLPKIYNFLALLLIRFANNIFPMGIPYNGHLKVRSSHYLLLAQSSPLVWSVLYGHFAI